MCRLLGYVAREPTTFVELLGKRELEEFTELSRKHRDGWGSAWATRNGVDIRKSPVAARASAEFERHAREQSADVGLIHLRRATLGLDVAMENTHPFTDGKLAFAHNGSILPPSSLDQFVSDDLQARREGMTDSERYFLAMPVCERASRPTEALAKTVDLIRASLQFTSLNVMIVSATELIAVCCYNRTALTESSGPDYYDLHYRVTPDAVVVSSSGWGAGWQKLENGTILTVQRGTLDISVRNLS